MLTVRLAAAPRRTPDVLAVPVADDGLLLPNVLPVSDDDRAEWEAFASSSDHSGRSGRVESLPRPLRRPERVLLVGVGPAGSTEDGEAGWRAAGAAVVRTCKQETSVTFALPPGATRETVRAVAEGVWLAGYRFRLAQEPDLPTLGRVTLLVDDPAGLEPALTEARTVVDATLLARDLTNTPSQTKTPGWFAEQIVKSAGRRTGLTSTVRGPEELAQGGFGGILAVGSGSARGPRLVELSWRPRGATRHVVLVGKGITFDTGGICIKPKEAMKLMRKDMAGAAVVTAATIGAAALNLRVRVTALAPLAENAVGGNAYRPGDVVRHYNGMTSEILNTDAEGRVVLADALAYAVARLKPDVIVDLATLTGAATTALGKRTAALYTADDTLADSLVDAGSAVGERFWRMPLVEDYADAVDGDIADVRNATDSGGAGSITAAFFLRAFVGPYRDRWAHVDMSAPAWSDSVDGELSKGATGFGVRTLLRWLSGQAS